MFLHFTEESLKRNESTYGQVAFNYDVSMQDTAENNEDRDSDDEETEPYVPPLNFETPADIDLVSVFAYK